MGVGDCATVETVGYIPQGKCFIALGVVAVKAVSQLCLRKAVELRSILHPERGTGVDLMMERWDCGIFQVS